MQQWIRPGICASHCWGKRCRLAVPVPISYCYAAGMEWLAADSAGYVMEGLTTAAGQCALENVFIYLEQVF